MKTHVTLDQSPNQREYLRLRFDGFELNEADARLTRGGEPIPLAPKAFEVLCALARQPQMLMTKSALLDAVWGHQFVSESVLKTVIRRSEGLWRTMPGIRALSKRRRGVATGSSPLCRRYPPRPRPE